MLAHNKAAAGTGSSAYGPRRRPLGLWCFWVWLRARPALRLDHVTRPPAPASARSAGLSMLARLLLGYESPAQSAALGTLAYGRVHKLSVWKDLIAAAPAS